MTLQVKVHMHTCAHITACSACKNCPNPTDFGHCKSITVYTSWWSAASFDHTKQKFLLIFGMSFFC